MAETIKIAGVPEHFNYPWHRVIDGGRFNEIDRRVEWIDFPGGTGAMAQSLSAGELDLAVMLTEGAVTAISKGCPARILHYTVQSPLIWGIHTGYASSLQAGEDVKGKTYAISRFGSGSHLMAKVQALSEGWPLDHMSWLEVKNLQGAKEALLNQQAEVFLWERYMTKPLVDEGSFRLLGTLPTPWPAFVLVVSDAFLKDNRSIVFQISNILLEEQRIIKSDPRLAEILSVSYGLQKEDVLSWLSQTHWSTETCIPKGDLEKTSKILLEAGVIEKITTEDDLMVIVQ